MVVKVLSHSGQSKVGRVGLVVPTRAAPTWLDGAAVWDRRPIRGTFSLFMLDYMDHDAWQRRGPGIHLGLYRRIAGPVTRGRPKTSRAGTRQLHRIPTARGVLHVPRPSLTVETQWRRAVHRVPFHGGPHSCPSRPAPGDKSPGCNTRPKLLYISGICTETVRPKAPRTPYVNGGHAVCRQTSTLYLS